jgi:aminoglycoside 3-N-acetyltransferase
MEVVTEEGTIVMPTHSGGNSEPSVWHHPPVPESWWQIVRDYMPPFDPSLTPTRGMGKIVDLFRIYPGVVRSNHPQCSFAAWGKYASIITADHPYYPTFGKNSPIGRVYKLGGKVFLLGVGHGNNTSLHLAEILIDVPNKPREDQGAAVLENGVRKWVSWQDIIYNDDDFPEIGKAFEESIGYQPQKIINADARLLSQKNLVDFAVNWMEMNRKY